MSGLPSQDDYKVSLDVFEGPLDLLLYLIRRDEVDIYDIPIERITTQYMQYLDVMQMLDLNIAGEFLVMAATLMMIKSRMLLPVEERAAEEDDEEDPRWDLVQQLVEYKKFKDAATFLQDLEFHQENIFLPEEPGGIELGPDPDKALEDVSIFDLIAAFNEALKKARDENLTELFHEKYTVAEKVDHLLDLMKTTGRARLSSLFATMTHRHEMICTFLAILELMRLRRIAVRQEGSFGEIELQAVEG